MSTLSITPSAVQSAPVQGTDALPAWARDVLAFVSRASASGQTVELNSKVETLTPAQMADRIGISRATVARRIADGHIKVIKVGNRNRIPIAEFERFERQLMTEIVDYYADDIERDLFG
jgi:excisionase family DNA binding protein